ncbi:MAG: hypothetical protein JXB48_08265 [Candidatus Latescibacteria bacterium]|nr:hypothetical protein [Candidatus Latescibacterota bacterium]
MKLKLLLIPVLLLSNVTGITAQQDTKVRILFTNNSNGKLENCHCRNDNTGGLAERVGFLRDYRKKNTNVLLLDSGGYMGLYDIDKKGPKILRLMNMMQYDGWGIGDQELYRSFKRFISQFGGFREHMINASLVDENAAPVFERYKIFTFGAVTIGVTGLVSGETFRFFPDESRDFVFESPETILEELIPEMKESCDYIVVLSQIGKNGDVALAEKRTDIDLIIGGHSQTLLEEAIEVSGCRIVQAGKGGGRVGEITLTFDAEKVLRNFTYRLIELDESYLIPDDIKPILTDK